jgi:AraC-like DNA-binding protein
MGNIDSARNARETMPFQWIGQTAIAASSRGVPIDQMMLGSGIAAKMGCLSNNTPIDPAEFHLFCNLLITTLDDELHGAGKARMMRGTGVLGLQVMASAPTLRMSLQSLIKLYKVAGTFCDIDLIEGAHAELTIRSDLPRGPLAFVVEEVLANWIYVQLCFLLQTPLKLSSYATSAYHPNSGQYHAYFGCPVIASNASAFRFPKYYLDMVPTVRLGATPLVDSVMYWLEQTAKRSSYSGSLYDDKPVSLSTLSLLNSFDMSFDACCDALSASTQDLRHALSLEGSTFRELRRVALVNRVRPQLNAAANLDDVAEKLGYSDARSLRRGLKSATGLTIARLRQLDNNAAIPGSPQVISSLRDCMVAT